MRVYFAVNKDSVAGYFDEAKARAALKVGGALDYCDFDDNRTCTIERYNETKLVSPLLVLGALAA